MSKLCVIYNSASHYRESIFKLIDRKFDCDWFFSPEKGDIKEMDVKKLKRVSFYKTFGDINCIFVKFGYLKLLFDRKYQTYLILPEVRSITDWIFFYLNAKLVHKHIFLWTHGWYGKEIGLVAKLKMWLYKNVDGVFLYSNYARQLLIKRGISDNKLFVIHNSLDYEKQVSIRNELVPSDLYYNHFGNYNPIIIFIGRLTKVKKLEMLIDAISVLKHRKIDFNLVLVGDGEEKDHLRFISKDKGIDDRIWFYGACYEEQRNAELIFNADLCVAPGNVGLTAMHSMVFGTPVITHNDFRWQMPEFEAIKDGQTGGFFDKDNVESLSEVIEQWFNNKRDSRDLVRNACYNEIDTQWNPFFQMKVLETCLKIK